MLEQDVFPINLHYQECFIFHQIQHLFLPLSQEQGTFYKNDHILYVDVQKSGFLIVEEIQEKLFSFLQKSILTVHVFFPICTFL